MPDPWQTRKQTTTEDSSMLQSVRNFFRAVPTPLAGLALGIASLGIGLEKSLPLHNFAQVLGALTSMTLTLLQICPEPEAVARRTAPPRAWQHFAHHLNGPDAAIQKPEHP